MPENMLDANSEFRLSYCESIIEATLKGGFGMDDAIYLYSILLDYLKEDYSKENLQEQVYRIHEELLNSQGYKKEHGRNLQQETENVIHFRGAGEISIYDFYNELMLTTAEEKRNCRVCINRCIAKGILSKAHSGRTGIYYIRNGNCADLDYFTVNLHALDIKWPLGFQEYCDIYAKSLVIIAGEPNSGKTAYCLNTARLNKRHLPVH
jgi:hypothetical protein